MKTFIETDTLKGLLPQYLERIGHPPTINGNGSKLTTLCPLHDDRTPSFTATLKGDVWLWKCFPCGVGGTVIELHAARSGRNAKGDFRVICAEIAELVGIDPMTTTSAAPYKRPTPKPPPPSKAINADELERMTSPWRIRLYEDARLREAFASELGLSPETLRKLTMPSLDALGVAPAGLVLVKQDGTTCTLSKPRLAYIGGGGFKIRDPFGTGKPRFWRVGELQRPWRSHWLTRSAPVITDVHILESESDCAAMIEAGLDDPWNQGSCVVASSGADGFDPAWSPLFAGRNVHFWPDDGNAGEQFYKETAAVLHGTAKSIREHKLNANTSTL